MINKQTAIVVVFMASTLFAAPAFADDKRIGILVFDKVEAIAAELVFPAAHLSRVGLHQSSSLGCSPHLCIGYLKESSE